MKMPASRRLADFAPCVVVFSITISGSVEEMITSLGYVLIIFPLDS